FSRAFVYSFSTLVNRLDVEEPRAALGLQILVHAIGPQEATIDLGGVPTTGGAVPVRVTIRNKTDRAVAFDPARLELADGQATPPLTGPGLANALASGPAGDRLRGDLLGTRRVPAHTTATGYLVFPPGTYRDARVTIRNVATRGGE